jgi:Helix-turn-helix domain
MSTNTLPSPGELVDEIIAAAILGTAVRTLRNWRALGKGPRYRKIGARMVRYHRADLAEFQQVMTSAADGGSAA